jgi:hypothetical protein
MGRRFRNPKLKLDKYKQDDPEKWKLYVERAAVEVYAYSPTQWSTLYRRVFGRNMTVAEIEAERNKRPEGKEFDFGVGTGKYGAEGEREHHKSLPLWVQANPHKVKPSFKGARSDTEFELLSGDRVDVVYHLPKQTIVLEAKSHKSNLVDLKRGVFQCIKYRAVKAAMDARLDAPVQAILVTETKLPGEIAALLRRHDNAHFQAPMKRT